jgi:hypothetical protein
VSNGRNTKKRSNAGGFDKAAQDLTKGLSPEAAKGLTSMVRDVASTYGYDDSLMIRRLKTRLKNAARGKDSWARDVLNRLENPEGATV